MSQENVEIVRASIDAYNRRSLEAAPMLEELDPEVEWDPALPVLLGEETTVYRGHEGARQLFREN